MPVKQSESRFSAAGAPHSIQSAAPTPYALELAKLWIDGHLWGGNGRG
jgi:hypothetical protein